MRPCLQTSGQSAGASVILSCSVHRVTSGPRTQQPETQTSVRLLNHGFLVVLQSWPDPHVWRLDVCLWDFNGFLPPVVPSSVHWERADREAQPRKNSSGFCCNMLAHSPSQTTSLMESGVSVGGHRKGETVSRHHVTNLSQQDSLPARHGFTL